MRRKIAFALGCIAVGIVIGFLIRRPIGPREAPESQAPVTSQKALPPAEEAVPPLSIGEAPRVRPGPPAMSEAPAERALPPVQESPVAAEGVAKETPPIQAEPTKPSRVESTEPVTIEPRPEKETREAPAKPAEEASDVSRPPALEPADASSKLAALYDRRFKELCDAATQLCHQGKFDEAKALLGGARRSGLAAFADRIDAQIALIEEQKRVSVERQAATTVYPKARVPRSVAGVSKDAFTPVRVTDALLDGEGRFFIDFVTFRPIVVEAPPYSARLLHGGAVEIAFNDVVIAPWSQIKIGPAAPEDAPRNRVPKETSGQIQRTEKGWTVEIGQSWEGARVATVVYELTPDGVGVRARTNLGKYPWNRADFVLALDGATAGVASDRDITSDGRSLLVARETQAGTVSAGAVRRGRRVRIAGSRGTIQFVRTTGLGREDTLTRRGDLLLYRVPLSAGRTLTGGCSLVLTADVPTPPVAGESPDAGLPGMDAFRSGLAAVRHSTYANDLHGPWRAGTVTLDAKGTATWRGQPLAALSGQPLGQPVAVETLSNGVSVEFAHDAPERLISRRLFVTITPQGVLYTLDTEAGACSDGDPDPAASDVAVTLRIPLEGLGRPLCLYERSVAQRWDKRPWPQTRVAIADGELDAILDSPAARLRLTSRFACSGGAIGSEPPLTLRLTPDNALVVTGPALDRSRAATNAPLRQRMQVLLAPEEKNGPPESLSE